MKDKTIREIIDLLNYHTELYDKSKETISDKEWDNLYFKLQKMEKKTGIIYSDSPTQNIHFETVSQLNKVEHDHLMLSLDKTKDINEINAFLKKQPFVAMFKLDGLTASLTYENGQLIKAETRGDGAVGEDILHNIKVIKNVPLSIPYKEKLVVDGEVICKKDDFIPFKEEYKNPRNFAAGSIRLLSSEECSKRNLSFIAWELIEGCPEINSFKLKLEKLKELGFSIVPMFSDAIWAEDALKILEGSFRNLHDIYPTDGYVFKFDDIEYGKKQGQTDHHFKNAIALKKYDEEYETNLKNIEWTMGRTSVLSPVAIYNTVSIEGSENNRASLHNISIMEQILDKPYFNQKIRIIKSNMIIPQVVWGEVSNDKSLSYFEIPKFCPYCNQPTEIKISDDNVKKLYCTNSKCDSKLINQLEHFFGKKGLDIKGLSKATFEKLIDWEWVSKIEDVFNLSNYQNEWINKPGFGIKSVDKILNSIENGKNTTLEAFISAAGIPLIGQTAAKDLANCFKTYEDFRDAVDNWYNFSELPNFGVEMDKSLTSFDYTEMDRISKILIFKEITVNKNQENKTLTGKTIVITGKLTTVKNRNEFKKMIEEYGGKVTSSISSKTDILINNDINSNSSKNKTAKSLGIPIISEGDFIKEYIEN